MFWITFFTGLFRGLRPEHLADQADGHVRLLARFCADLLQVLNLGAVVGAVGGGRLADKFDIEVGAGDLTHWVVPSCTP